jgi:hypothetical protein
MSRYARALEKVAFVVTVCFALYCAGLFFIGVHLDVNKSLLWSGVKRLATVQYDLARANPEATAASWSRN